MKTISTFLGFLPLEYGVIFMVIFDIIHLLYHMLELLPSDAGKHVYIYYKCFDLDPDVFLFFTTNVSLLLIKIGYGIKVITKKYQQYTNTYAVLTTLSYGLILFLDFAMSAYLARNADSWYSFIYFFVLLLVCIYLSMVAKSLSKKIARDKKERENAQAAGAGTDPLKENMLSNDQKVADEDIDESSDDEDDDGEDNHDLTTTEHAQVRA